MITDLMNHNDILIHLKNEFDDIVSTKCFINDYKKFCKYSAKYSKSSNKYPIYSLKKYISKNKTTYNILFFAHDKKTALDPIIHSFVFYYYKNKPSIFVKTAIEYEDYIKDELVIYYKHFFDRYNERFLKNPNYKFNVQTYVDFYIKNYRYVPHFELGNENNIYKVYNYYPNSGFGLGDFENQNVYVLKTFVSFDIINNGNIKTQIKNNIIKYFSNIDKITDKYNEMNFSNIDIEEVYNKINQNKNMDNYGKGKFNLFNLWQTL